jgi:integrase
MLAALADAMPTAQDRAAVLIAGYCGLRAGEVWALKIDDVGIRRLRVDGKITEASVGGDTDYTILPGGQATGPTKTNTDAPVAMPEFVAEALAGIIDPAAKPTSFIFTDSQGGPIRQSNWYLRVYKPAIKSLPPEYHGTTFHDLRHTCAAYMIEAGFHPKVIQQQMQHSSIQTTMDVYGHLFEDGLDAVADAMDAGYRALAARTTSRPLSCDCHSRTTR